MGSSANAQFEILDRYSDVAAFVADVVRAADADKDALGFFAASIFDGFARRDRLFVIVKKVGDERFYAGHLLFDPRFPRAKVMQMFVLQEYRRQGLAARLADHLQAQLTHHGFLSIYARVAEDLVQSNDFWERQGYYVQRVVKGGSTRNRQILVRCRELDSPQLFPTSGIDADNPLGLENSASDALPMFLLDLNVLYDVGPRRLRHDDAVRLFQAERSNFCRLAISSEIRKELQRTAIEGRTDPMESYIATFPEFPLSDDAETKAILQRLALVIFPKKTEAGTLTANDKSDLRHVATAIRNELSGLITNDGSILAAAQAIEREFRIDVISSSVFTLDSVGSSVSKSFATQENSALTVRDLSRSDEVAVRELLSRLGLTGAEVAAGWLQIDTHGRLMTASGVWCKDRLVAYGTWVPAGKAGTRALRVAIDETNTQALGAARILLLDCLDGLIDQGPQSIRLELPPNQSNAREVAASFGFRGSGDRRSLTKLALGQIVTASGWAAMQNRLLTKTELRLPPAVPQYRHARQQLQVLTPNGNQTHIALDVLESLLFPCLFCLPGRPALLTPIQKAYAAELLGASAQGSLLPRSIASSFYDRHYLSDPKTLRHFKPGTLMLFYESGKGGGRAAVIAIARVREAYLRPADADGHDLEHSVLTPETLGYIGKSNMKTVTVFDNIFQLPRVVPLASLCRLGCGKATQLITTRPLTDEQLQGILNEAFDRE